MSTHKKSEFFFVRVCESLTYIIYLVSYMQSLIEILGVLCLFLREQPRFQYTALINHNILN